MLQELELIQWIANTVADANALRDDTFWDGAVRRMYTTDMLVEGRHFSRAYYSPQDVGWKAAAVNISDIAATGGHFRAMLVSLAIPDDTDLAWIQGFYEGLASACSRFGGVIAGGDTVGIGRRSGNETERPESSPLVINVAAIGDCPPGEHPGHRFNARPGDYILTTGFHGLSYAGLKTLQEGMPGFNESKKAHLRPQPRIEAGLILASRFERYALMDSSDGLADALLKIAQTSGQTLQIDASSVPIHPEIQEAARMLDGFDPWQAILYGGEDFELVATVPSLDETLFPAFRVIGRVISAEDSPRNDRKPGAWLRHAETGLTQELHLDKTYRHFTGTETDAALKKDPVAVSTAIPPATPLKAASFSTETSEEHHASEAWALIPAGGRGSRFSPDAADDKLLTLIDGIPVLQRTLTALLAVPSIRGLVIVSDPASRSAYQQLTTARFPSLSIPIIWAEGGKSRRESVFNGLCALPAHVDKVVIHDAARPLIRPMIIQEALDAVQGNILGSVVGIPIHDTLRRTCPDSEQPTPHRQAVATLDRTDIWQVQTPQVFAVDAILRAHRTVDRSLDATDDAQLMEEAGLSPVVMVKGETSNLKITTPEDIRLATAWLSLL